MTSPNRDKYRASGGKMLDENDSVFDLTAWIKSVGVSILTAFKIKNVAGVEINPATEEKQDSNILALDTVGISNKADSRIDPATEDKQDDIIAKLPVLEENGAMPVNIQDQHTHFFGGLLSQVVGAPMTLSAPTVVGNYTLEMTAGHSFIAGDEIIIVEVDESFHGKVISVSTNTLTLDQPIDKVFSTSAVVFEIISNMNVDGSSTVQEFVAKLGETTTIEVDVTGIRFQIVDNVVMDDGKFGGISALTNGIVLQIVHTDGTHNLLTAKTNGKLGLVMNHIEYNDKAPAGQYGFNCYWDFRNELGVTIRLQAGDELKMLIQDDLTDLTTFNAYIYGHLVTD